MASTDYLTRNLTVLSDLMGGVPDEFTPAWLEKAAAIAESKRCNGCPILFELGFIVEHAARCARWMKDRGIERARFVGPLRPNPFSRGQTIVVKKGSVLRRNGQDIVAKRDYRVRIHSVGDGYTHEDHGPVVRNPTITWPGTGGYWTDLDLAASPLPELVS